MDATSILEGWKDAFNGMDEAQKLLARGLGMAVVTVASILYGNYRLWKWLESEPTIAYTVSPPHVAEDAKALEQPAVKVENTGPNNIRRKLKSCYHLGARIYGYSMLCPSDWKVPRHNKPLLPRRYRSSHQTVP